MLLHFMEVICKNRTGKTYFPNKFVGMLEQLVAGVDRCFEGAVCHDNSFQEDTDCLPSSRTNECLHTGICTGLRQVRGRPKYEMDGLNKEKFTDCRHGFEHIKSRTGGIFLWFCKHGVCYSSYVLPGAEGRDEAFSFLLKYLKKPPKYVIYDFACALHSYCLNREPEFFKNTIFLVDYFHWLGHVACAQSYNINEYPQLRYLNEEIAEQCNSAYARVRNCVTMMSQNNFVLMLRLYLDIWNEKKLQKMAACREYVATL